ncbi:hypothetical protein K9K77_00805 [Candidatus Babeliales bacterium]|nr:hypothetical protein [Candidatus Babeliales bacterium]
MHKKGFSVFEILIAVTIFSFLGTLLFQSLFQVNKSLKSVISIASADTRYLLFDNLWEKEIAGVFVPQLKKVGKSSEEDESLKKDNNEKDDQKKEKIITPPQAFFCKNGNGGNMSLFTFITTNPLSVYNMRKPRTMRIVYELKPDNQQQGLFALYRKEVDDIFDEKAIDSKGEGKEKSFKVFGEIKTFTLEFYAESVKKKEKEDTLKKDDPSQKSSEKNNSQKGKKEPREFSKIQSWDPQKVAELAEEGKEMKLVPAFIRVNMMLYSGQKETEAREYIFSPLYDQQEILLEGIKPLVEQKKETEIKGPQQKQPPTLPQKSLNQVPFGSRSIMGGMQ